MKPALDPETKKERHHQRQSSAVSWKYAREIDTSTLAVGASIAKLMKKETCLHVVTLKLKRVSKKKAKEKYAEQRPPPKRRRVTLIAYV